MKSMPMAAWGAAAGLAAALVIAPAAAAKTAEARPRPDSNAWREVAPENLLLIETRYGEVAVELEPDFAPLAVARMRALAKARFYDGLSFYRVIDGFVAQGGIGEGTAATKDHPRQAAELAKWPPLKAEFDAPVAAVPDPFVPSGSPDLFAPEVGHVRGFPVGRDLKDGREWILHCPGTMALARDNGANTASTEFYVVIGEAPRRLDRNLTAFGRVLGGMQYLQKLARGNPKVESGVIQDKARRDPILSVRLASDLPPAQRPHYQVMKTPSAAFAKWKADRVNPAPEFYVRTPPKVFDVCLAPVPARKMR